MRQRTEDDPRPEEETTPEEDPVAGGPPGLPGRPVVFGEVLFDVFPPGADGAGEEVLGGAPFNVAWHLAGLGLDPLLVSRVGTDQRGRRVRGAMEAWGLDLSGLQEDPDRPTGQVRVELEEGQPRYTIVPEQAYDRIDGEAAVEAVRRGTGASGPALICHGTLIERSEASRRALARIFEARFADGAAAPGLVDLNLRPPWWERRRATAALERARWAKLNEDELLEVTAAEGASDPLPAGLAQRARWARSRFGLEQLLLTRGAEGALLVISEAGRYAGADGEERISDRAPELRRAPEDLGEELVDTVGAGDAFTAVWIAGLLAGWPARVMLERGTAFALEICRRRGATHREPELYRELRQGWGLA